MSARILVGDCRVMMATLPDVSVDAVVCDPPYELGFMGKSWDASGIAYDVEVWRQALRVLKPGGHLLAFSGSRTYHRMTCAIEDAGFEIRDQIMWVYGSGFPKSLDVSKAIDKVDRTETAEARARIFTAWMRSTGITARQIDDATSTRMGHHYTTHLTQPSVATADLFDLLRPLLPPIPDEIEDLVRSRTVESENMKRRDVIETREDTGGRAVSIIGKADASTFNVTAPYTASARQWSGWGTALKPAHEPICLARKPLVGTVAANVLAHGTGAINVDGCRVGTEARPMMVRTTTVVPPRSMTGVSTGATSNGELTTVGRWPANFIHDGSEEATVGLGEAARFFYTAKASREDREEGCAALPNKTTKEAVGREPESAGANNPRAGANRGAGAALYYCALCSISLQGGRAAKPCANAEDGEHVREARGTMSAVKNHHPTVKPTELMRYLVRLVTPPGGTVLDPFTGSGSTGRGAVLEGFRFIGCELSPEYAEIARARIRAVAMPLFPVEVE